MSWPEVVKKHPFQPTASKVKYYYVPYLQTTVYEGNLDLGSKVGTSNLVWCTNKSPFRPGQVKLTRFDATRRMASSEPESYYFKSSGTKPMIVKLDGCYASTYGSVLSDVTLSSVPSVWDESLAGEALVKAMAKMKAPSQDVGVMLAEFRETLEFLRNPLKGVVDYVRTWWRDATRGRRHRPTSAVDALSDSWMSYRYGLRPLLYDVSSIMQGLRVRQTDLQIERAAAKGALVTSVTDAWSAYTLNLKFKNRTTTKSWVEAHASQLYRESASVDNYTFLLESLGLDAFALPSLIWEMVPLSFVVDWFFNVGTWLKAIQPSARYNPMGNSISVVSRSVTEIKCVDAACYYAALSPQVPRYTSVHRMEYNTINRKPNQSLPFRPQWTFKGLSFARQADALSLVWQRLPHLLSGR